MLFHGSGSERGCGEIYVGGESCGGLRLKLSGHDESFTFFFSLKREQGDRLTEKKQRGNNSLKRAKLRYISLV